MSLQTPQCQGRRLAFFMNGIVAVAACALTCLAIGRFTPFPDVPMVTAKLDYFAAHKEAYDTLFFGSSRLYHALSPKVFDAAMAQRGRATHSFNFAIDGMVPPEVFYFVRKALTEKPTHARWAFVEIAGLRTSMQRGATRDAYWQNPEALGLMFREMLQAPIRGKKGTKRFPKARRLYAELIPDLQLFFYKYANIGMGRNVVAGFFNQPGPTEPDEALGPAKDGFVPLLNPTPDSEAAKLTDALQKLKSGKMEKRGVDPLNRDAYARLLRDIKAAGITPFLVVTPTTTRDYQVRKSAPPDTVVFAFDDPAAFPNLYEPDRRMDYDHLNPRGAEEFSITLAERFSRQLSR